mgnify:CR=1 FL=1
MKISLLILFGLTLSSAYAQKKTTVENLQDHFQCGITKDCEMLAKHIRKDSDKCLIPAADVESEGTLFDGVSSKGKRIKGKIRYVSIVTGKYQYDTWIGEDNTLNIRTKVYIKNHKKLSSDQLFKLDYKLRKAEKIWERNNPYSYNINLIVDIVKKKKDAYFKVKLKEKFTRGPYFRNWSLSWTDKTFAHEIGHVLGLDDEYKNTLGGGDATVCSRSSLKCNSHAYQSKPKDYHYYLVLRRLLCE